MKKHQEMNEEDFILWKELETRFDGRNDKTIGLMVVCKVVDKTLVNTQTNLDKWADTVHDP